MKESDSMKELRKIREEYYEKTKNMTIEEEIAYLNSSSKKMIEKYNLKKNIKSSEYITRPTPITINEDSEEYNRKDDE